MIIIMDLFDFIIRFNIIMDQLRSMPVRVNKNPVEVREGSQKVPVTSQIYGSLKICHLSHINGRVTRNLSLVTAKPKVHCKTRPLPHINSA